MNTAATQLRPNILGRAWVAKVQASFKDVQLNSGVSTFEHKPRI